MMKTFDICFKTTCFTALLALSTQASAFTFDDLSSLVTDSAVTTSINTELLTDHSFSNSKFKISTNDGVVSVSGTADTIINASRLIQMITASSFVKNINPSNLKVMNVNEPLDDMIITAEIRGLIYRYQVFGDLPTLSPLPVSVSTDQGNVTISSNTATQTQLNTVIKIAQFVPGVHAVDIDTAESDDTNTDG